MMISRRANRTPAISTLSALAAITVMAFALPAALGAQVVGARVGGAGALGPKDGAGLPPLDTSRVAVGTQAPDFTLEAKDGGTVTLSQFRERKTVVLVFYRGHW